MIRFNRESITLFSTVTVDSPATITANLTGARDVAFERLRPRRPPASPRRPPPALPQPSSSAPSARTRETMRQHVERVAKVRQPGYEKPRPVPHVMGHASAMTAMAHAPCEEASPQDTKHCAP